MTFNSNILIVGGGLAGLLSAIHLSKNGFDVTLIEKDQYPKHKVCGEYISNEVLPYLNHLDINIHSLNPSHVSKFMISTQKGAVINSKLPLGGFGISRFVLDHHLWKIAASRGVKLINDQVNEVVFSEDKFEVKTFENQMITASFVIGAYGKRSVLDKNLQRSFSAQKSPWLAVKGHYKGDFNSNIVALHNFEGGYCGISKVENDIINACYLVHYDSFKKYKNIDDFQQTVLFENPYLKAFFEKSTPLFNKPLSISQINFDKKKPIENHIFMVGDSAGLIHPLCGNGMAMAIQSAQIVSTILIENNQKDYSLDRNELEKIYTERWESAFKKRLKAGRLLQHILLNPTMQSLAHKIAIVAPNLVPKVIKQTHGKPLVC